MKSALASSPPTLLAVVIGRIRRLVHFADAPVVDYQPLLTQPGQLARVGKEMTFTMANDNKKLDAVKLLCNFGYKPFLLSPGTKIPFKGSGGVDDATENVEEIANKLGQYPDANLAISAWDILIVDVDNKNGKTGDADLAEIEEVLGKRSCPKFVDGVAKRLQFKRCCLSHQ